MRISSINTNYKVSFNGTYQTKSVLQILTGYTPRRGAPSWALGKELTGIEFGSDEYMALLPEKPNYFAGLCAYLNTCANHIVEQRPELMAAENDYNPFLHLQKNGEKKMNDWFKEQIKKFGKTIEITPFKLDKTEILKEYQSCVDAFDKI